MDKIPYIGEYRGVPTLFVHDEPFFALSGETHNSSASDLEYMERSVWPNLEGLNCNSVIVPVCWELLEPEDGRLDFALVDGLLAQARGRGMKLILLWFGLWKNGASDYVPAWVKARPDLFFRARDAFGAPINTISPLCDEAVARDARAFAALMAHLRDADSRENTVIAVQVENEIGLLNATYAGLNQPESQELLPLPEPCPSRWRKRSPSPAPGGRRSARTRRNSSWPGTSLAPWSASPRRAARSILFPAMCGWVVEPATMSIQMTTSPLSQVRPISCRMVTTSRLLLPARPYGTLWRPANNWLPKASARVCWICLG